MDEMTEKKRGVFAEDFLWGGAVAAHQLEGGYLEGGKGLSIMDVTTGGDVHTLRRLPIRSFRTKIIQTMRQ